jgi:hypothetical protein
VENIDWQKCRKLRKKQSWTGTYISNLKFQLSTFKWGTRKGRAHTVKKRVEYETSALYATFHKPLKGLGRPSKPLKGLGIKGFMNTRVYDNKKSLLF